MILNNSSFLFFSHHISQGSVNTEILFLPDNKQVDLCCVHVSLQSKHILSCKYQPLQSVNAFTCTDKIGRNSGVPIYFTTTYK